LRVSNRGGGDRAAGAGTKGDFIVLGLAALMLATAASAEASPSLVSSSQWWEKITYTMSGEAEQQSCVYESSLTGSRTCDESEPSSPVSAAGGSVGSYTKITIERRFSPGDQPHKLPLQPGDTLLGGQVMALAFDEKGAVRGCKILAASGEVRPAYSCASARAERFEASATRGNEQVRQGLMTIVVYGHEEELV